MRVEVKQAWLIGPLESEATALKVERALRAKFPTCSLELSPSGIHAKRWYLTLHNAACTEKGLTGFVQGVLWVDTTG